MLYKISGNVNYVNTKVSFVGTCLLDWNFFLSIFQDGVDGKGLKLGKIIGHHF